MTNDESEFDAKIHCTRTDENRFRKWAIKNRYGDSWFAFSKLMDLAENQSTEIESLKDQITELEIHGPHDES